jgi:hypothetical protein
VTSAPQHVWDFFIAHAGEDAAAAEELFEYLAPRAQAYLDTRSLRLGDDWDIALRLAQERSLVTVVLISANSDAAYYQREEIASAIARARIDPDGHRVVPVFLNGFPNGREGVPYGLRIKHGIALSATVSLRDAAERLIELLGEIRPWQLEGADGQRATGPRYVMECCLCVEASLGFRSQLAGVWDQASGLPFLLGGSMARLGKPVTAVRAAVMAPVEHADVPVAWHSLPADSVSYLNAIGRATAPRTPEAGDDLWTQLRRALTAQWTTTADHARHNVVVWANVEPHWSTEMLDEIFDAWERMSKSAKRLTLFAPETTTWQILGTEMDYAVYYPHAMGERLTGAQRLEIADLLATSV